jgi:sugar phosphate isomerase/epimerase
MELRLFKTLWGHTASLPTAADEALAAGFDGLEGPIPVAPAERRAFIDLLRDHRLLYIAEISATGFANPDPAATVQDQLDCFERLLALSLEASPLICTTMAGNDLWSFGESLDFLRRAQEIAGRYQARVGFETHRGRSLFHPVVTRDLLLELPDLELTVDFSHWCVVTERLALDLLPEILALCARRALHVHARIGYDQGAQVPDPRAPEYQHAVRAHFAWWRRVWESQRERGQTVVTMTPEFGPDGYLHLHPFTQAPVADLWTVNAWTGARLREAYQQFMEIGPGQ